MGDISTDSGLAIDEMKLGPTRDSDYYFDLGDCVIQVENTLFKVHRWVLSRDDSIFHDMFMLPTGEGLDSSRAEGSSDTNPIILRGDNVKQFSSLLWALYALPDAIVEKSNPLNAVQDMDVLLSIAEIAQKYHFGHIKSWALGVLSKILEEADMWTSKSIHAPRFLDITYLCDCSTLRDTLLKNWSSHLLSVKSEADIDIAVLAADKYSEVSLQGPAYYYQVVQMSRTNNSGGLPPGSPFSPQQHMRLLRGFWWLSHYWDDIVGTPPNYQHSPNCRDAAKCVAVWKEVWTRVRRNATPVYNATHIHILARLQRLPVDVDTLYSTTKSMYREPEPCLQAIHARLESLLVELPEIFLVEAILSVTL